MGFAQCSAGFIWHFILDGGDVWIADFLALDTFSVGASVDIRFVARVVAFYLYVALSDHTHHYSMFLFSFGV
jgi:hypothetical protein